ncbi:FUSC family protein [Martelella endophytica]|uniref:FUSC family protein n=1 Tax=Martelella endophytica TaxID=1486262 RepID=UPI000696D165|nr:FUSC family protein [Martelella endophytica]
MANPAQTSDLGRRSLRLIDDLKPFPGRFTQSVSIGIICAISCVISMMYHFPEAAIGCYLVIFMAKPSAADNVLTGVGLILAVTFVVFLLIGLINLTIDYPAAQIAAIVITSFIFLYVDSATKLGEQAGIVALVISFVMTLLGSIPIGEIATRAVLYAWAMVFVPMAVMAVYNLLFGIPPQKLLRQEIADRLNLAADWLEKPGEGLREKLTETIGEGTANADNLLKTTGMFHLVNGRTNAFLSKSQAQSYRLLLAASGVGADTDEAERGALAAACRRAADIVFTRKIFEDERPTLPDIEDKRLSHVADTLQDLVGEAPLEKGLPLDDAFVAPDAFTNPVHLQFALKTTLAAVTCYFIYTAADWSGIHTAMITCYVAALGTTGETVHKLVLRITGCLIGAFIGLVTILYLIPQMESVGALAALIFVVVALSAWVSTGSERISYGGVQIALAFLLTVIQGFSPGTDLSSASDRIIGILLGNTVVYLVFTLIWPVSVSQAVRDGLGEAVARVRKLAATPFAERRASLGYVALIEQNLGSVREAIDMASYEPHSMRWPREERSRALVLADQLNERALDLMFRPEVDARAEADIATLESRISRQDLSEDTETDLTGTQEPGVTG